MTSLRKFYRSTLLAVLILFGLIVTIFILRGSIPTRGIGTTFATTWLGLVARTFGVRIKSFGTPLAERTLFVSNHLSWLDIFVLGKLVPVHFLSKKEVKTMPIFGWLASRAGTLYIERGNNHSAKNVNSEIVDALKIDHNVLVFAEGTTSNGDILKFHGRMMQSAIDAQSMVQPIAIFYPIKNPETQKHKLNSTILFTGNTSMGESYNLIARSRSIDVEVHFLKPISIRNQSRKEIAQHAFEEVAEAITSIKNRPARP
jgi:1-acyl-sn-glycerol-3-phosphate acyltransferase